MSAWIEYVKSYAKEHNIKYKDALKEASKSYKGSKEEKNEIKIKKTRTKIDKMENVVLPEPAKKVRVQKPKN